MTIKRKHVYSVKLMEILIKHTKAQMYFDFSSGRHPGQTSLVWEHQQEPPWATDASATETDSEKKENEKGNLLIPISSIHST